MDKLIASEYLYGESHALFNQVIAFENGRQGNEHLVITELREITEGAIVDPDDRHLVVAHHARSGDHRAVAAQHNQQVNLVRQTLFRTDGYLATGRLKDLLAIYVNGAD